MNVPDAREAMRAREGRAMTMIEKQAAVRTQAQRLGDSAEERAARYGRLFGEMRADWDQGAE